MAVEFYLLPGLQKSGCIKKVWSRSFIRMEALVSLESNKQYPTLVLYGARIRHIPIQEMSVTAFLDSLKFNRFPSKDKSETLSSKICMPTNRPSKDMKKFTFPQ